MCNFCFQHATELLCMFNFRFNLFCDKLRITFDFYNEVFRATNLLTILAGHTHRSAFDVKNGITQVVSSHNATGYFSDIRISTLS